MKAVKKKNTKYLYHRKFVAKMKQSEEDVKAGRTTKITPTDIWSLN
jgi:hypothetical protein